MKHGRLIDADALIHELNNSHFPGAPYIDAGISIAIGKVCDAPTIEPERKTGKWIKVHGYCTPGGDPVWACSECGKGIHVYGIEHGTYGADIADDQWKACPNCGAKMEVEEHGKN